MAFVLSAPSRPRMFHEANPMITQPTEVPSTGVTWTSERVQMLHSYVLAGLSCAQIAAEIGVTRTAVIGKIHRLGLTTGGRPGRPPAALAQRMRAASLRPSSPRRQSRI